MWRQDVEWIGKGGWVIVETSGPQIITHSSRACLSQKAPSLIFICIFLSLQLLTSLINYALAILRLNWQSVAFVTLYLANLLTHPLLTPSY